MYINLSETEKARRYNAGWKAAQEGKSRNRCVQSSEKWFNAGYVDYLYIMGINREETIKGLKKITFVLRVQCLNQQKR